MNTIAEKATVNFSMGVSILLGMPLELGLLRSFVGAHKYQREAYFQGRKMVGWGDIGEKRKWGFPKQGAVRRE